jgi:protein-S-isoprenylcysteine O-methyltransferase Ste14
MPDLSAISIKAVIQYLWTALGVYFLAGALFSKRPREPESTRTRFLRLVGGGVIAVLLFWDTPALAMLHRRIFPSNPTLQVAGLFITATGLLLTAFARFYLGRFWGASVVVKDSHRLIRSGPYARLRHPIYTGLLMALVGTEMVYAQWRFILIFVIALVLYWRKAQAEEALLAREFGAEFEEYQRHTGFLLPRLRPSGRVVRPQI